jgi:hypothetical protein
MSKEAFQNAIEGLSGVKECTHGGILRITPLINSQTKTITPMSTSSMEKNKTGLHIKSTKHQRCMGKQH